MTIKLHNDPFREFTFLQNNCKFIQLNTFPTTTEAQTVKKKVPESNDDYLRVVIVYHLNQPSLTAPGTNISGWVRAYSMIGTDTGGGSLMACSYDNNIDIMPYRVREFRSEVLDTTTPQRDGNIMPAYIEGTFISQNEVAVRDLRSKGWLINLYFGGMPFGGLWHGSQISSRFNSNINGHITYST